MVFSLRNRAKLTLAATCAALAVIACVATGASAALTSEIPMGGRGGQPVEIQAKQLSHDEKTNTVTASGDVEATQGNMILHADQIVYKLDDDTVAAIGNVSLLDENGDVHFAEYIELSGDMKNGYVQGLLSMLADGSRFTATEGRREDGVKTTMTDASYTPCKVCETDPKPLWQIKADKVIHDSKEKTVEYKNARLEFLDVPVVYAPIFSHADPSVKRKSGFMRPLFGWKNNTGGYVQGGYYFGDIAPDKDATLQVRPSTRAGTLVQGQWRERFESGRLQIDGSIVQSDRHEEDGRVEEDRTRGSIFANGLFDLDEKWRAGFNLEHASDKEFLRLYDISSKDVLENEAYAERFSDRNYSRVSALSFQDVRLGLRPQQADVLPMAEHRMYGAPNATLGGRWTFGADALGLARDGSGQDVQRGSVDAGWERRDTTNFGLVTRTAVSARSDYYRVQDREVAVANPALDDETTAARGMAVASVMTSYPVVKRLPKSQILIEPIAGFSLSPQIDDKEEKIPNEDSIDMQLDANNLFADNRFPGIDRQEDGARFNYGVKTGAYGDNGRYGKIFLGQSYRFDDDTIFPQGSGLESNSSDVVGQINIGLSRYLNADYRFQLDNENLSPQRHEIQATGGNDKLTMDFKYLYIAATAGTGFTESREQAQIAGIYRLNERWWVNSGVLTDLGEEPGLRKAALGLNYNDECFSFGLQGSRNLTYDASGENGTVIMMRIGFRNIGEFTTPSIELKGSAENPP